MKRDPVQDVRGALAEQDWWRRRLNTVAWENGDPEVMCGRTDETWPTPHLGATEMVSAAAV